MRQTLLTAAAVIAVGIAGVLGCNLKAHASSADAATPQVATVAPPEEGGGNGVVGPMPSLAPLVKKLRHSVVNIYTTQNVHPHHRGLRPFGQEPDEGGGGMEDFFHHFFGGQMPQQEQKRQALGSGFIIGDGLVLTNNHVIAGADEIKVKLEDGRTFDAKVVGKDESLDVGLLRLGGDAASTTQPV